MSTNNPTHPRQPWRVVVTRPTHQAGVLTAKLRAAGFVPVLFPTIALEPWPSSRPLLDTAVDELASFDWILFTSSNGVRFFCQRLAERGLTGTLRWPRVAAIGETTAAQLLKKGIPVDFVPTEFVGEALVVGLGEVRGQKLLLPRARAGRPEIAAWLRAAGADLVEVPLYDTVTAVPSRAAWTALQQGFEAIIFTSPSAVDSFVELVATRQADGSADGSLLADDYLSTAVVFCLGPITAAAAQGHGFTNIKSPATYTLDHLLALMHG